MAIPRIAKQLAEFEPMDLVSVLHSSLKPGLKKRELKRQMFAVSLQSLGLLAQAIKGSERLALIDTAASAEHLQAAADLRASYFDVYRVSKNLILKPQMRE